MSTSTHTTAITAAGAIKIAHDEHTRALSRREWKHRLAGYGFGVKETAQGSILTDLIGGFDVCALPADLAA